MIPVLTRFPADLYASLSALARDLGIEVCDDAFVVSDSALNFLKSFAEAGGCWTEMAGSREWHVDHWGERDGSHPKPIDPLRPVLLSRYPVRTVGQVTGIFQLELNGQRALLASRSEPPADSRTFRRDTLILLGATYQSCFNFLEAASNVLKKPRVIVWGSDMHRLDPEPISEDDVVLRDDLKRELLGTLDRFWSLADQLKDLGVPARRGVLLAGPPGTGKGRSLRMTLSAPCSLLCGRGTEQ